MESFMKCDTPAPVRLAVLILASVLTAVLASPAQATFPGTNGSIGFTTEIDGNREIRTTSATGGPGRRLTNNPADDRSPAWNVSGAELAFASDRDGDFEIYRMPAAGSAPATQLTFNAVADEAPAWAPSNTQLVILRDAAGGDTDLVILAADGSGATTPLTASAPVSGEVEPTWAPNGARIGFSAFPPGDTQRDIFTVNPDGTGLTNLTNTPGRDDREPNWSPGNARITYSSFHDSNYEIHVMNADGTGDANITNYPSLDDRDPVWSPDAARIAFTRGNTIWHIASTGVFPVPVVNGAAPDWQRVPPPVCSDGVDNDGDGLIDYPNDPGCTSAADREETDNNPPCSDGIDNDGDLAIDYGEDPGCTSASDTDETNPACNDGIDNDNDGDIDYPIDPGCGSGFDNDETNPACSDGIDNDGDGAIDFPDDSDCISIYDNDEQHHDCSDGVDNDGDGKNNLDDPGCDSPSDNDESNPLVGWGHLRPKSAAPLFLPLVPAYADCTSPNRTHGPPLEEPSCSPPRAVSSSASDGLTVGTADSNGQPTKSAGAVTINVVRGDPASPYDEADVEVSLYVTDVRRAINMTDYPGQIHLSSGVQITDRWNAATDYGGSQPATVAELGMNFDAPCTATADPTVGSTCSLATTVDAVVPGAAGEGVRSVWEYTDIAVLDGASNDFLRPGVFIP
jgi:hypothetical protein